MIAEPLTVAEEQFDTLRAGVPCCTECGDPDDRPESPHRRLRLGGRLRYVCWSCDWQACREAEDDLEERE